MVFLHFPSESLVRAPLGAQVVHVSLVWSNLHVSPDSVHVSLDSAKSYLGSANYWKNQ